MDNDDEIPRYSVQMENLFEQKYSNQQRVNSELVYSYEQRVNRELEYHSIPLLTLKRSYRSGRIHVYDEAYGGSYGDRTKEQIFVNFANLFF
jgi:hypothetical protein